MTTSRKKRGNTTDEFYNEHNITTLPNPSLRHRKEMEKEQERIMEEAEEETQVVVQNVTQNKLENGERVVLPNRIAFEEKNVAIGRLPIWYLNALGSMNQDELDDFIRDYGGELSLNEQIALQLLEQARGGVKEAVQTFWNIQTKMLTKTNVANQVNITVNKPDSVVSNLLDEISAKIRDADTVSDGDGLANVDRDTAQNL